MKKSELEKMRLEALRALGREQGLAGVEGLSRGALVEKLAEPEESAETEAPAEAHHETVIERVQHAVEHAAARVEEAAHKVAERVERGVDRLVDRAEHRAEELVHESEERTQHLVEAVEGPEAAAAVATSERPRRGRPQRPSFDVPSSTVHPHADELETLVMARLYAAEGSLERAVEVYEKLLAAEPDDEVVRRELDDVRARLGRAAAPPPPPAPVHDEPFGMLDLEELPESYGIDECEVLYKDPFWVFAYWEVTDGGISAARGQLGPSGKDARLVLRLFTTVATAAGVERHIQDVDLSWNHGRRYMQTPRVGAHLRVAVGLLSPEGYFAPIANSSLLRLPHSEPAAPGPVQWMEVVAGKSRGRDREPIVVVQRGMAAHERGLPWATTPTGHRAQEGTLVGDAGTSPRRGPTAPTPTSPTSPSWPPGSGSGGLR